MANRQKRLFVLIGSLATFFGVLYVAAAYDGYKLPFFGPHPGIYQIAFGAVLAVCSVPFWVKGLRTPKTA